jgi:hypothetical protein
LLVGWEWALIESVLDPTQFKAGQAVLLSPGWKTQHTSTPLNGQWGEKVIDLKKRMDSKAGLTTAHLDQKEAFESVDLSEI